MRYDGIAAQFARGKHCNGGVTQEPGPEDWLSLFEFPVTPTNEPVGKADSVTGADRLDLTGVRARALDLPEDERETR